MSKVTSKEERGVPTQLGFNFGSVLVYAVCHCSALFVAENRDAAQSGDYSVVVSHSGKCVRTQIVKVWLDDFGDLLRRELERRPPGSAMALPEVTLAAYNSSRGAT